MMMISPEQQVLVISRLLWKWMKPCPSLLFSTYTLARVSSQPLATKLPQARTDPLLGTYCNAGTHAGSALWFYADRLLVQDGHAFHRLQYRDIVDLHPVGEVTTIKQLATELAVRHGHGDWLILPLDGRWWLSSDSRTHPAPRPDVFPCWNFLRQARDYAVRADERNAALTQSLST